MVFRKVLMDSLFYANIDKLLKSTRLPVAESAQFTKAAGYLHTRLIEPIQPFFSGTNLLISPDRELHKIPFEILLTTDSGLPGIENYEHLAYLGKELNIQYTYSFAFSRLKASSVKIDTAVNNFVGFAPGFNDFALPDSLSETLQHYFPDNEQAYIRPLPYSRLELEQIQERFLAHKSSLPTALSHFIYPEIRGFYAADASESGLYSQDLRKTQYIHFSTHGLYDQNNPAKTAILLQPDQLNDGIVMSSDIYGLDLNARLVVLNACESALGYWSAGEGMVGPAQAFLVAGAENVLVALWKTENRSTAFFFDKFYSAVLSGESHAEALRTAQRAC
ncbi:MAG: CHAT domain-containing protein, partial [Calditrichota bacterium]